MMLLVDLAVCVAKVATFAAIFYVLWILMSFLEYRLCV